MPNPRPPASPSPRRGLKPTRSALDRPPQPDEAATPEDESYIASEKLRRRLIELNP